MAEYSDAKSCRDCKHKEGWNNYPTCSVTYRSCAWERGEFGQCGIDAKFFYPRDPTLMEKLLSWL